ncbi:hypothetical protein AU476_10365 [Cupriavidus sp. UYMSc13B]|nr:hypothetical protein AU476_10365 [Cupriavidus sp. UYMSc13B]
MGDLAARMRTTPEALLERLREAGVDKSNAREPVYEADVKALSALYRKLLGPRAIEIAEEIRAEAVAAPEPARAQVNRVILVGKLGDDPETRYPPSVPRLPASAYRWPIVTRVSLGRSWRAMSPRIVTVTCFWNFCKGVPRQG